MAIVVLALAGLGYQAIRLAGGPDRITVNDGQGPPPDYEKVETKQGDCVYFQHKVASNDPDDEYPVVTPCGTSLATFRVAQIARGENETRDFNCQRDEFKFTDYAGGISVREKTAARILCLVAEFTNGDCYMVSTEALQDDGAFNKIHDYSCRDPKSLRVARRADGEPTDAACRGIPGRVSIYNYTRPPLTYCFVPH